MSSLPWSLAAAVVVPVGIGAAANVMRRCIPPRHVEKSKSDTMRRLTPPRHVEKSKSNTTRRYTSPRHIRMEGEGFAPKLTVMGGSS